jgi:hypothetical protein
VRTEEECDSKRSAGASSSAFIRQTEFPSPFESERAH